jgi:hypothetical protein
MNDVTEPRRTSTQARHRSDATVAQRRTQLWVRSRTAGRWDELSSPSRRSVNATPSVSSVRQITRHDRRSPMGVRKPELIGDGVGSDPRKFRAAIRDVDQGAGTLQVPARNVDRRGQMPSEPEVLAPVVPLGPVQMARHSQDPYRSCASFGSEPMHCFDLKAVDGPNRVHLSERRRVPGSERPSADLGSDRFELQTKATPNTI